MAQSVISAYAPDRREPGIAMLAKLIEATGHQLTLNVEPCLIDVCGCPIRRSAADSAGTGGQ